MKTTGYVLWQSSEYVTIATLESTNSKTGNMVQVWILNRDISPVESVKTGLDASTNCQGCPFSAGNGCYVNVGQAPLGIWRGYHRGIYPTLSPDDYSAVFGNRKIRFGAYGNPSILPISVIKAIAEVSAGWTGYFHDWHLMTPETARAYGQYFMASTDTETSRQDAISLGLRYFHVAPIQPSDTRECLADTKGLECKDCLLCQGNAKSKQLPIWINPHGSTKTRAILASQG